MQRNLLKFLLAGDDIRGLLRKVLKNLRVWNFIKIKREEGIFQQALKTYQRGGCKRKILASQKLLALFFQNKFYSSIFDDREKTLV